MKPSFGDTMGLATLSCIKAWSSDIPDVAIRYAMTKVADLDFPSTQWAKTVPPRALASAMKAFVSGKYCMMFCEGVSVTGNALY